MTWVRVPTDAEVEKPSRSNVAEGRVSGQLLKSCAQSGAFLIFTEPYSCPAAVSIAYNNELLSLNEVSLNVTNGGPLNNILMKF